jgi:hypothetical protein
MLRSSIAPEIARTRDAPPALESAGLAHDQARRARDRGVAHYGGAFDDRVRWETLTRTFSEDVVVFRFGRGEVHGLRSVIAAVMADAEAGVELHPTRVLAGERVTVLEGRYQNPVRRPLSLPADDLPGPPSTAPTGSPIVSTCTPPRAHARRAESAD